MTTKPHEMDRRIRSGSDGNWIVVVVVSNNGGETWLLFDDAQRLHVAALKGYVRIPRDEERAAMDREIATLYNAAAAATMAALEPDLHRREEQMAAPPRPRPMTDAEAQTEAHRRWGTGAFTPRVRRAVEVGCLVEGVARVYGRGATWEAAFEAADRAGKGGRP